MNFQLFCFSSGPLINVNPVGFVLKRDIDVRNVPSGEIWLERTERSKVIVVSQCTIVATCFFSPPMPFGWEPKTKRVLLMLFRAQQRRGGGQLDSQKSRPDLFNHSRVFHHPAVIDPYQCDGRGNARIWLRNPDQNIVIAWFCWARRPDVQSVKTKCPFSKQEAADYLTDMQKK